MISDKAITYGDNVYRPAMQSDTGVIKSIQIGRTSWRALVAGDPGFASSVVSAAERMIHAEKAIAASHKSMMECLSSQYARSWEQALQDRVLGPHLLDKTLFAARPSNVQPLSEQYFQTVAKQVEDFSVQCSLLVCGFDERLRAHMFSVGGTGNATDHDLTGFHAIGIGAEAAVARLLNWGADRADRLDEALYAVFDAKAHAEIIQGVGYAWDGFILTSRRSVKVPRTVQRDMDWLFDETTRSPFDRKRHRSSATRIRRVRSFTTRVTKSLR
jgi:hypothetical protein